MKKSLISLLCLFAVCVIFAPAAYARLAKNDRAAVVQEAFYALDPYHNGQSYKDIPYGSHNYASIWNYVDSDHGAYKTLKGWYGTGLASLWSSFFSDVHSYGYSNAAGQYGDVGRGGQCKFFANLIEYRSDSYTKCFPLTKDMLKNAEGDLTKAVPGDVLFSTEHFAIVVSVEKSGKKVTALGVIDSNFVSDAIPAKDDREVIARHTMDLSYLQKHKYMLWKGITYYSKPYSP
jgi:hypothetical protein